jgi:hypothetical protein
VHLALSLMNMSMKIIAGIGLCTTEPAIGGEINVEELPADLREIVVNLREKLVALGPNGDFESIVESLCSDRPLGAETWSVAIEGDGVPVEFWVDEYSQSPLVKRVTDHLRLTLPKVPLDERISVTRRFQGPFVESVLRRKG